MGAFLEKPKTEKSTEFSEGGGFRYGLATMQGWRIEMEDAHCAKIGLDNPSLSQWAFFAVFDGHAGKRVANHCAQHLLDSVLNTKEFKEAIDILSKGAKPDNEKVVELVRKGLRAGFLALDSEMRELPDIHGENERSGSTAVAVMISPTHLYFANLGDSRTVFCRSGSIAFATEDHKPFHPKERERITNAGGSVMIQRVNGSLAVSRAFGDYEYKSVPGLNPCEQLVSPEPDVHVLPRQSGDEFLLLACDGIFDVISNQELCEFVKARLLVTDKLPMIACGVLDACLSKGSRDNMSLIVVCFPDAPSVQPAAVQKENELVDQLDTRIRGVINLCDSMDDVDSDYVLRVLMTQEIPGTPPGAGLHALRPTIDEIVERIKSQLAETASQKSDASSTISNVSQGNERHGSSASHHQHPSAPSKTPTNTSSSSSESSHQASAANNPTSASIPSSAKSRPKS